MDDGHDTLFEKLLSHRLRGFGEYENSPTALAAACRSATPYLEIDTRVTRDGAIFVCHDPVTGHDTTGRVRIGTASRAEAAKVRFRNGEPLLSLQDALDVFRGRRRDSQRLCIDIKDFGFEAAHLDLVRSRGLEAHVVFVSWIPWTIVRLKQLGTTAPLVLSHVNLLDRPLAGWIATRFTRWRLRMGHHLVYGSGCAVRPRTDLGHGYQHVLVCARLPDDLLSALRSGNGALCVHRSLAGPRLRAYCRDAGIGLWVFSVGDALRYARWAAADGIDVVFCDDAPAAIRARERDAMPVTHVGGVASGG